MKTHCWLKAGIAELVGFLGAGLIAALAVLAPAPATADHCGAPTNVYSDMWNDEPIDDNGTLPLYGKGVAESQGECPLTVRATIKDPNGTELASAQATNYFYTEATAQTWLSVDSSPDGNYETVAEAWSGGYFEGCANLLKLIQKYKTRYIYNGQLANGKHEYLPWQCETECTTARRCHSQRNTWLRGTGWQVVIFCFMRETPQAMQPECQGRFGRGHGDDKCG